MISRSSTKFSLRFYLALMLDFIQFCVTMADSNYTVNCRNKSKQEAL